MQNSRQVVHEQGVRKQAELLCEMYTPVLDEVTLALSGKDEQLNGIEHLRVKRNSEDSKDGDNLAP